jgi:hypothetical protein
MEYIKHEIDWNICINCTDLFKFIENNSDKNWNTICDISNEAYLFEEYSGRIGYLQFLQDKDVYNPNENRLFFQRMINVFFETYNIDKSKMITVLFTD